MLPAACCCLRGSDGTLQFCTITASFVRLNKTVRHHIRFDAIAIWDIFNHVISLALNIVDSHMVYLLLFCMCVFICFLLSWSPDLSAWIRFYVPSIDWLSIKSQTRQNDCRQFLLIYMFLPVKCVQLRQTDGLNTCFVHIWAASSTELCKLTVLKFD